MSKTFSTPAYPSVANPQRIGLPMKTASAPRANALRISVPLLTPPSKNIGIFFPFRASEISFSDSKVEIVVSNCLAPWLETKIASAPFYMAMRASSLHMIPFAITGNPDSFLISLMISQPMLLSLWYLAYSANPESFPLDTRLAYS